MAPEVGKIRLFKGPCYNGVNESQLKYNFVKLICRMKSVTKYKNNNYFIKLGISPVVPSFNVQGNLEKNNFVIEMGSFSGLHSWH